MNKFLQTPPANFIQNRAGLGHLLIRSLKACGASLMGGLLATGTCYAQASPQAWETREYRAQYGLDMINAAQAYAAGYTGKGVTVGVMDSGMDARHGEFHGKITGGYDFLLNRPIAPGSGIDENGHGTHVAGTIAAQRDGLGMHGVAFDAELLSVRTNFMGDLDTSYSQGWKYLATQGVAILNNSFGVANCSAGWRPPCNVAEYRSRQQALDAYPKAFASLQDITDAGTLMVFASGNARQLAPDLMAGAPVLFPEFKDNWLAVVAVDQNGERPYYSNACGIAQDWCLAAPGGGDDSDNYGIYAPYLNKGYDRLSGTSMAAPHVAGAAALVKQAYPFFTARHLQQTLLTTATDLGDPDIFGWGLLNAGKAVHGPARFTTDFVVDTLGFDANFANDIDGPGGLVKQGAGRLGLSGTNSYSGATIVQGGGLIVNGRLNSPVTIEAAGMLGGTGRVAALQHYGLLAPGNSIGTLTIDGDYEMHPGAVLAIEADGPRHDQLHISGQATLHGGTVQLLAGQRYSVGENYRFLTAAGGVQGQFDQIQKPAGLPFIEARLENSQTNALGLRIRRSDQPFAPFLQGSNQHALGQALDAVSAAPPASLRAIFDHVLNDDGAALGRHLDALSGEAHASTQTVLLDAGLNTGTRLLRRAQANLAAGWLPGAALAFNTAQLPAAALPRSAARPLWLDFHTGWGTYSGASAATARAQHGGFMLGADTALGDGWRLGLAAGYTQSRSKVRARASQTDIGSYTLALTAGRHWLTRYSDQGLQWLGGLAFAQHHINSRRHVHTGGQQTLKARQRAHTVQLFTELSHGFDAGNDLQLQPYARYQWLRLHRRALQESGGPAALRARARNDQLHAFTLGLRGHWQLSAAPKTARISVGLGWRHLAGDVQPVQNTRFAAAENLQFDVQGVALKRNAAVLELRGEFDLGKHSQLQLSYDGQMAGRRSSQHQATAAMNIRF